LFSNRERKKIQVLVLGEWMEIAQDSRSKVSFLVVFIACFLVAEVIILYYFLVWIPKRPPETVLLRYLIQIEGNEIPLFTPADLASLKKAFEREKEFLSRKISSDQKLPFGQQKVTAELVKESAELFFKILEEARDPKELNRLIRKWFNIYLASGQKGQGGVLFTGYYSPVYMANLIRCSDYQYPLYLKPSDLKVAELGEFDPRLAGERIVYRVDKKKEEIVPYYTRRHIVQEKALEGKGLELVYLRSKIDRFHLMTEGSGKIVLEDGQSFWANYAVSNGRPYTSLSKLLQADGKFSSGELTLQGIKEYFTHHPHEIDHYLNQNQRFIFHREEEDGPYGATGIKLTPLRSLAVDKSIFPLGSLAYIEYQGSRLNKLGNVEGEVKCSHFVFCQDSGVVIKGPGRADLYFGEGDQALKRAERTKSLGRLYFLIKKN
jgi:membrane-bound lytic murein transglycosylase A